VKFNLNDEPLTVTELTLIPYYRHELLSQTKKTVIVDVIIVTSVMQAEGVGTG
jgi:hypothetical protein